MHGGMVSHAPLFQKLGITTVRDVPMSVDYPKNTFIVDGKKMGYAPNPTKKAFYKEEPKYIDFVENAPDGSIYWLFDGDADRIVTLIKIAGAVTELSPNDFGAMATTFIDEQEYAPEATVVLRTVVTTRGIDAAADKANKKLIVVPVGSKNFNPYMREDSEEKAATATEESGHFVARYKGKVFFDDTLFQLFLMLEMVAVGEKDLISLVKENQEKIGYAGVYERLDPVRSLDFVDERVLQPV